MKHTKILEGKNQNELMKILTDARKDLFTMRIDNERKKLNNPRAIFHKRKEIARMLTKIKELEVIKNG